MGGGGGRTEEGGGRREERDEADEEVDGRSPGGDFGPQDQRNGRRGCGIPEAHKSVLIALGPENCFRMQICL